MAACTHTIYRDPPTSGRPAIIGLREGVRTAPGAAFGMPRTRPTAAGLPVRATRARIAWRLSRGAAITCVSIPQDASPTVPDTLKPKGLPTSPLATFCRTRQRESALQSQARPQRTTAGRRDAQSSCAAIISGLSHPHQAAGSAIFATGALSVGNDPRGAALVTRGWKYDTPPRAEQSSRCIMATETREKPHLRTEDPEKLREALLRVAARAIRRDERANGGRQ